MSGLLPPSFVLAYSRDPGYVLLSRTHAGVVEMVGGPLDFRSGKHRVHVASYRTADGAGAAAQAALAKLAKPPNLTALGPVAVTDFDEARRLLVAVGIAYESGTTRELDDAWRRAAQPLFAAVPPQPIITTRVLSSDEPASSSNRYDW